MNVIHNFITEEESNNLIKTYIESQDKYEHKGTYNVEISSMQVPFIQKILKRAFDQAVLLTSENIILDNSTIVCWPEGSSMRIHKDHNNDAIAVIIYLNDNYSGGHTEVLVNNQYVESIKPIAQSSLFFDGRKNPHRVTKISQGTRYTLAIWYQWKDK